MVSMYQFEKIRKLHSEGKSKSEIARELGINWKTAKKYVDSDTPPAYRARSGPTKADLFGEFLPRVKCLLEMMPDLSDREVFEYLFAEGYRGSERTINRRLARLREQKPKERFFEQEYQPGEQSQFDFKEKVELPFLDGPRTTYLHVGTLPFSDTSRVRCYPSTNFECYMDGIHSFFASLGGRTENIRIDNLSACVAKVLKGNERKWTAAFSRATQYYGFGVLPCSPGRGNEKGDVERDIRTLSSRIRHQVKIQAKVFADWSDANRWLENLCISLQSEKSKELLEEERKSLKVLAEKSEGILCREETVPASTYGTVRVLRSAYSVPDNCIGCVLRAVPGPYELCIYRGRELVARHPRKSEGENSLLLEHILPSLVRKPRAMIRWSHRAMLFPSEVFQKYYDRLVVLDPSSAEREFLKSINLIHYTTIREIEAGVELVMGAHESNYFEHLRELLLIERRPDNVIDMKGLRPLTPNLSEYDLFIPRAAGDNAMPACITPKTKERT
jgi:transposase